MVNNQITTYNAFDVLDKCKDIIRATEANNDVSKEIKIIINTINKMALETMLNMSKQWMAIQQ